MSEKKRYSDEELEEFKELILKKLAKAQEDYEILRASLTNTDGNDVADTSPTFKVLEEGACPKQGGSRTACPASAKIHQAPSGRSYQN